ncbi:MAG: DUF2460 domain-containing protein [Alphaproteobacteria bacterium]|nr:DUF2460 domain-containing protein [Alphaproteobacteria bacterium]
MPSFSEELFPLDIAYGSEVMLEYSTHVSTSKSGHEVRNVNWKHGRLKYNISYGIKTISQLKTLMEFFRDKKGKAVGFRFRDFSDFKAENERLQKIAPNTFQLIKGERIIQKPVIGSVNLFHNNQMIEGLVDYASGIVTTTDDFEAITANFEFDVAVRFDTDTLSVTNLTDEAFDIDNIYLIEIKV